MAIKWPVVRWEMMDKLNDAVPNAALSFDCRDLHSHIKFIVENGDHRVWKVFMHNRGASARHIVMDGKKMAAVGT